MKKNKYLQIFNYLKEFSTIRNTSVRDIEAQETQYPEIFWLNEVPENKIFENVLFSDFNTNNDYWLKIRKPKEPDKPIFPKLSEILESWVEPSSLLEDDLEPKLKEEIETNNKILHLEDFPEVIKEFEKYINQKWIDDLIVYKTQLNSYDKDFQTFEMLNNIYKRLFRIFNKAQQYGDEYELIMGVGLLNFKEGSNSPKIFRHILTQCVDIDFSFSQKDSQIVISPNLDSLPQIETDSIIDLYDLFEAQNIIDAENSYRRFIEGKELDSLFTRDTIDDALQMFAERISSDGCYRDISEKPNFISSKPMISFSPALLLRKRNTKSFTALYEKIIENIENSDDEVNIKSMNDIVGEQDNDFIKTYKNSILNEKFNPNLIFFPKEYNNDQIEIIRKTFVNNKVLVQGPPGTGKSHTIANIICHLLANGQKILVTASNKRALEVLKEKLPQEFKNLTVNLLSGDSSSIQDLQSSVNSINDELSQADLNNYYQQIQSLEKELNSIREKIAFNTNELIKIKEKATRKHTINQLYSGTLTEIAQILELKAAEFNWYKDSFSDPENKQIITDLNLFIDLNNLFRDIDISDFNYNVPVPEKLPSIETVKKYKQLTNNILQYYSIGQTPAIIKSNDYDQLKNHLTSYSDLYSQIKHIQIVRKEEIIKSLISGNVQKWNQLLESTKIIIDKILKKDIKNIDRDIEIKYNSDNSIKQLKNDAQALLDYLRDGSTLSGIAFNLKKKFLPKETKEKLYFIECVKVNGSPCDSIREFEMVLNDLEIQQDIDEISKLWEISVPEHNSYINSLNYWISKYDEVVLLLKIFYQSEDIRLKIENSSNLKLNPLQNDIDKLIKDAEYNQQLEKYNILKWQIDEVNSSLSLGSFHPISEKIITDLKKIDFVSYDQTISELQYLIEKNNQFQKYSLLKSELKQVIPNIIESIDNEEIIIQDLSTLPQVFLYKHAQNEINKLLDINYEEQLFNELQELDIKEKKCISHLASKKAWCKIVENLQNNRSLRQHLDAWVMAVRRIGVTGKGKRALKFKRVAQQEMEYCKDSVPCWIMPLYKVAETIRPEQGMYDFVIVDEASQLGPDAIFLLYISKNIIIVGDDKQTSPEFVGVSAETMTPHIKRYLKDIPRSDYFGTEFSFFDHARLFCDGVTVLREHFRCMPEIIEFSNKYFYAPDGKGLYPLKQYSEDRLEPLMPVYCQKGFVEGNTPRIINRPEAENVVETISNLISDKRYDGKTIGVIVLQGNQQSILIENLLLQKIGEQEFHKRKIICGNSASFQGDERDIILLSLVTAHNHSRAAFVKPEDERRFNVAVSRAKEQIWLFHSIQLDDLNNTNDLRYKLLDHFLNYKPKQPILKKTIERKIGSQPDPFDSWFEVDVYNEIVRKNLSVIPQYEVAKGRYRIDLVALFPDGTKIAIECDGDKWHGPEQYQNDLMRQKVLERCGWQFFRVRGYEFYLNREKAMEPLWKMIHRSAHFQTENETPIQKEVDQTPLNKQIIEELYQTQKSIVQTDDLYDEQYNLDLIKEEDFTVNQNVSEVIRYFNLFKDGTYIMSLNESLNAEFTLAIRKNQKNGYLLQCYNSGHINKVLISVLLARKIGKEYKNGLNLDDNLNYLTIIESEKIIGLYFFSEGKKKFKAHLTENISSRELLHLQGYKVLYNDFENIEFKILPVEILNEISRLVFQSFNAGGKPIDNEYYEKEWSILKKFDKPIEERPKIKDTFEDIQTHSEGLVFKTLIVQEVKLGSIVKIRYLRDNKIFDIQLVEYSTRSEGIKDGIQNITINSPLAISILGKSIGEIIYIINTEYQVEIIEILNE